MRDDAENEELLRRAKCKEVKSEVRAPQCQTHCVWSALYAREDCFTWSTAARRCGSSTPGWMLPGGLRNGPPRHPV